MSPRGPVEVPLRMVSEFYIRAHLPSPLIIQIL